MAADFGRMLALKPDYRRLTLPVTVNGRAVYCAVVRRWPGRQAWMSNIQRGGDLT